MGFSVGSVSPRSYRANQYSARSFEAKLDQFDTGKKQLFGRNSPMSSTLSISFQLPNSYDKKMEKDDLPTLIQERRSRRNSSLKGKKTEKQDEVEITKFEGQIASSPGLPKKNKNLMNLKDAATGHEGETKKIIKN